MELPRQLKLIRSVKNWTQEGVAGKLGISTQAYAKIERGETDVNFSRLQQIAEIMEIELSQLFGLDEKNVFNLTCDHNNCQSNSQSIDNNWHVNFLPIEQIGYKHELEKANLIIEQKQQEINYLKQEIDYFKQQVNDLRDIINLLKK